MKMFGIQGLNPWNFLFIGVFLAWLANRRRADLTWDMPRHISVLLLMYLGVILVGVLRAVFDHSNLEGYSLSSLISEELINKIKWVLPGILLFDGCRTRRRVIMALICLLAVYFLISVQVIRFMPLSALGDSGLIDRSRIRLGRYIGYSACDLSAMLAGVSWGLLAALPLLRKKKYWVIVLATAGVVTFGQALTGGRAGYIAWGATGLMLCLLKWRKYLILAPVAVILLPIILPGVTARMLEGFGATNVAGQKTIDQEELASGRLLMWPYVIDKISQSPLVGYGRLAMKRTGLYDRIETEHPGTGAPHPHNMYLETLLDNGLLGSLPILLFWWMVVLYSARLFRSSNRLFSAVGGLALSLILAQLVAGLGSQHFYPEESTLGMWVAIFLSLRVYLEWTKVQVGAITVESTTEEQLAQQQVAISPVRARGTAGW